MRGKAGREGHFILPSGNLRINLGRFFIMRYPNAAKGIKKIWIAEILGILAVVLAIALVFMLAANNVDTNMSGEEAAQMMETAKIAGPVVVLGFGMMLLMLASYLLNLIGISNAAKDEEGFKRALWVLLASMVFGIVAAILENSNAKVANWLKVPSTLFELVVIVYVLEGIGSLARNLGKSDIVDLSKQCKTWMMCALVLSAAAEVFVALGTEGSTLSTTSGVAAALLQIVAYVVYLRVLNKARQMQ